MITRASFRNFKSLREVDVTFDSRLTVLVGPNGSGKSSILQGIQFLTGLTVGSPPDPEFALQSLTAYATVGTTIESMSLDADGVRVGRLPYRLMIAAPRPEKLAGELSLIMPAGSKTWRNTPGGRHGNWVSGPHGVIVPEDWQHFDTSAVIRFSATRLAMPTLVKTYPPQVDKYGTGLAATLSHIKARHPTRYEGIASAFKRVIPGVTDILFDKEWIAEAGYYGDGLLLNYRGADGVKASHVSSGTLFALGLLTVALGPDSPNVILLDDLDHGLHPKAQMELIEVFRELVDQNPDLQIIATSHSPYILDRLEWNEVLVTSLREDGSAMCVPLTDHPDVDRWREAMSPGEFWSHLGDDWVWKLDRRQVATPAAAP